MRHQLVEIWQANAGGRYVHKRDQHPAALDPHFTGVGRCLTDNDGGYRFTTIKPGPYPWRNHHNAWRPAHIHFSLFGTEFTQRMITQMYFPGDPLFALDPIYQSITDESARDRLVATYDHDLSQHEWADRLSLGHRADRQPRHADGAGGGRPEWRATSPRRRDRPSGRSSTTHCRTNAATSWCRRRRRAPCGCTATCTTATAAGARRAAGDPAGRPERRVPLSRVRCRRDGAGSPAGDARARTRAGTTGSAPSSPGRPARGSRPSSRSRSSLADCSTALFTRVYLPVRLRSATAFLARLAPSGRDTLARRTRRGRQSAVRHPSPRRAGDALPSVPRARRA